MSGNGKQCPLSRACCEAPRTHHSITSTSLGSRIDSDRKFTVPRREMATRSLGVLRGPLSPGANWLNRASRAITFRSRGRSHSLQLGTTSTVAVVVRQYLLMYRRILNILHQLDQSLIKKNSFDQDCAVCTSGGGGLNIPLIPTTTCYDVEHVPNIALVVVLCD